MEKAKCKAKKCFSKFGIKFLVGTEIETTLKGINCELCDYCHICDNCPTCEHCQENMDYCSYCDPNEVRDYAIRIGIIDENQDIDICEVCQEYNLWRDIICQRCDPCTDCEYYRNPEYCPYSDEYLLENIDFNRIEKYIDRYYEDGSCGLEFPTKPFSSIAEYYKAIKTIVSVIGKENIKTTKECGGHINISWINQRTKKTWKDYKYTIAKNIMFFSDLLSYMFCSKYTYCRSQWATFPPKYHEIEEYITDKANYPLVLLKSNRIEIRFPDAVNSPNNHTLLTATLLAISFNTKMTYLNRSNFHITKEIYEDIRKYGNPLLERQINILKDKYTILKRIVKPYLIEFSRELRINLVKALDWRFKYPRYTTMAKLNFKQFSLIKNVKLSTIAMQIQRPLLAYC